MNEGLIPSPSRDLKGKKMLVEVEHSKKVFEETILYCWKLLIEDGNTQVPFLVCYN